MAIHEQKRENLMVQATAYVRRMLVPLKAVNYHDRSLECLFAGQRSNGRWSLYFDESPVLQFNDVGALRRLFVLPRKFHARGGELVELIRLSQGGRVVHQEQVVGPGESMVLLSELGKLIERTRASVERSVESADQKSLIQVHPSGDGQLIFELLQFLSELNSKIGLADTV